jgi:predicted ester cyclase
MKRTKKLIYRFFAAVEHYLQGEEQALDTLLAPHFVDQVLASGREGILATLQVTRESFSQIHLEVRHLVVEGDTVIAYLFFDYCHTHTFMKIPPTHRRTRFPYVVALRVADGMVVERLWHVSDEVTLWRQLGYACFLQSDSLHSLEHTIDPPLHQSGFDSLKGEPLLLQTEQRVYHNAPNPHATPRHHRPWGAHKSKNIGGKDA